MSEEEKNLIGIKVKLGVQELINENEMLQDNIYKLQDQLQQKENIIKEVREYIKTKYIAQGVLISYEVNDLLNELLEILDKEVN